MSHGAELKGGNEHMKRLPLVIAVAVVLAFSIAMMPVSAAKPGTDFNGPHFNLNLVGKKSDWSGGGNYDNADRHTMFIPENTTDFSYISPEGDTVTGSIAIEFTQGDDWVVVDGNAFDDGWCGFQLAPGKYKVYVVAKAKPGYTTNLGAWVYVEDEYGSWYVYNVGSLSVTKSKQWSDATPLFTVSPNEDYFGLISEDMWIFDYLNFIEGYDFGDSPDITDSVYLWDIDNNGNKLIKLRFYPV
jgi:hypothetical protein